MPDTDTLRARLARLEAALDDLVCGQSVTSVTAEGETVTYRQTDAAQLRIRIAEIRMRLEGAGVPFGVGF